MGPGRAEVRVLYGALELHSLRLPFLNADAIQSVTVDDDPLDYTFEDGTLTLDSVAEIRAESILRVNSIP